MSLMDRVRAMWEEIKTSDEKRRLAEIQGQIAELRTFGAPGYADDLAAQQYAMDQLNRRQLSSIQPLPGQAGADFMRIIGEYSFRTRTTPLPGRLTSITPTSEQRLARLLTMDGILCNHTLRLEGLPFVPGWKITHGNGDIFVLDQFCLDALPLDDIVRMIAKWLERVHTDEERAMLDTGTYDYYDNIEPETFSV